MKKNLINLAIIIGFMLVYSGCVKAISKEVRAQMEGPLTLDEVRKNPKKYQGKMILWGGVIVSSKNLGNGTLLEIVQKPVNSEGRPRNVDRSEGRFLTLYGAYLDVAIYSEGREITVAGKLKESRMQPLGEIEYLYPVIHAVEVHLWPVRNDRTNYKYPYWHYPYWYYPHRYYYPRR